MGCGLRVERCRLRVMRWTTNMGSVALHGRRSFKRITAVGDEPRRYHLFANRYSPFAVVLVLTGGSCSCTTDILNKFGNAGALPSSFVPARPKNFGTPGGVPSRLQNFFGTAGAVPSRVTKFFCRRERAPTLPLSLPFRPLR